ncbi:hypothetical protein [Prescottella equi]|uniref:hypothetical protein n=1 Tax=Rhodococcus hoagii TaxID=43767 RepID=UPI000A107EED|nr:hypothetical protein [Prescottella equi]ORL31516.1 hypothetical protein A6I91_17810 [Prescottella equi]ORL77181.1 hypothetical protein A5N71_15560 [Prescottella equi]ORM03776.1 hypothetical protein A5N72_16840 [Prescottella equi]
MSRRERTIAVQMFDDTSAGLMRLELDDREADRDPIRSMFEDRAELVSDDDHESAGDEPLDPDDPAEFYKDATEFVTPP